LGVDFGLSLNTSMNNRVTLLPNGLASFIPVKKGNWIFKVSVMKSKQVLVVAAHTIDRDIVHVKCFTNETAAASFLEYLATQE